MINKKPSPESPLYSKVLHDDGKMTRTYFIVCNEGWRESIVCEHMYEWTASWLVDLLQEKPYALGYYPTSIGADQR